MARQARAISSMGLYYVELKGGAIFPSEKYADAFLKILEECFSDGGVIYGVSLKNDTARMVVKESGAGISAAVKSLKTRYARYFNRESARTGKVFADRFKSIPYESIKDAEEAVKSLDTAGEIKVKRTAARSEKPVKKPASKPQKPVVQPAEKPAKKKANKNLPSWLL